MTLEEQLESFYVDAGLTDEADRAELAPEGDVERWLTQARLRIGPIARYTDTIRWSADDTTVTLPSNCSSVSRVIVDSGYSMPTYDEWGGLLVFRAAATADGSATILYTGFYELPTDDFRSSDPDQDAAALAAIDYALGRFYRKLAGSRVDYRRYSTIPGHSGVEATDLRDLADDHLENFETAKSDLGVGSPSSYYGD